MIQKDIIWRYTHVVLVLLTQKKKYMLYMITKKAGFPPPLRNGYASLLVILGFALCSRPALSALVLVEGVCPHKQVVGSLAGAGHILFRSVRSIVTLGAACLWVLHGA